MTASTLIQKTRYSSIKYGCCGSSLTKKINVAVFFTPTLQNKITGTWSYRVTGLRHHCAAGISSERSIRTIQHARCVCSVAM